jgi:hypothetical protein
MSEIVNLNRVRKAKAREDRAAQADANRTKFGRTKAERERQAAQDALVTARLDAHKRED